MNSPPWPNSGFRWRRSEGDVPAIPLTRLGLRPIHPLPEWERNHGVCRTILLPLGEKVARSAG